MNPRLHNTLSYSVTALAFLGLTPWHKTGAVYIAFLWSFHFLRRTWESLFVHRYSGRRVPTSDFLLEYIYYWGFAAWITWSLRSETWGPAGSLSTVWGTVVFFCGEAGNAWAHGKLRRLRSSSSQTTRDIPRGGLFELISCPHYLFEVISWCGFYLVAQVLGAAVFLCLGAIILSSYAWSRHRQYQQMFDGREGRPTYPAQRRAILPGVF